MQKILKEYLTFPASCISESCIKIKIRLNFYFHTSLWRLKSFYEGLKVLNFPTENLPSSSLRLTYLTKPFIQQFKHFLLAISYLYTGEILLFLLKAFRVIKHSKCCINSFRATGHFLYTPWKYQKTSGFLMFSGGIERNQWHEMGWIKILLFMTLISLIDKIRL